MTMAKKRLINPRISMCTAPSPKLTASIMPRRKKKDKPVFQLIPTYTLASSPESGALLFALALALTADKQRLLPLFHHRCGDHALRNIFFRGDAVHHIQHEPLHDGAQTPGARLQLQGLFGNDAQGLRLEFQGHAVHLQQFLELLDQCVLGLGEDPHQHLLIQRIQGAHHRHPPDELGNQPVAQEILGHDLPQDLADLLFFPAQDLSTETNALLSDPALDDLFQPVKGSAADEQDVGGIDLDKLLMGMLAPALRRYAGNCALQDLQQCLLHAFSGNIAGDGWVLRLAGDLVDLIYVDDALLSPFHIVVCRLDQPKQDVLHIFAHIAGLGEAGGISNGKGNIEDLGQGLGQERLAAACGPQHEDVAFLQLHIIAFEVAVDAFVVIVHSYSQGLLGFFLPDNVLVQGLFDLLGLGYVFQLQILIFGEFLFYDLVAQLNTFVADVDPRPGDEFLDLFLHFAAKRTLQLCFFIAKFEHPITSFIPYCPELLWTCLLVRTPSMMPYSTAAFADM